MQRASTPLLVTSSPLTAQPLQRRSLTKRTMGDYDERWVQELIHNAPSVLPITETEPAFSPLVPVCVELPLSTGYLDNLLVTPNGDLIIAECKLWRNVEARRAVVAQVIDYAKAMQRLSYDSLEAAIRSARREAGFRLYDHVIATLPEHISTLDEAVFVDAVSRNLRRGRCLLAIVGDGITEGVEGLAEFLQQHAGLHFALVLIRLAVHDLPGHGTIVVPSVPLRTTNIVRGIVQMQDGQPTIVASVSAQRSQATVTPPVTLSEEEFFASLDGIRPGTSVRLINFLKSVEDLQVDWTIRKMMSIRMTVGGRRLPFFVLDSNGDTHTDYATDAKALMRSFIEAMIAAVTGTKLHETPKLTILKRLDDSWPTIWDVLDHEEGVRNALIELNRSMIAAEVDG